MRIAAGILFICPEKKTILLGHRTDPSETWANFGGGAIDIETPIQAAMREVIEETGFSEGNDYKFVSKRALYKKYYTKNFLYKCYLAICQYEKEPKLNHEHSGYAWVSLEQIPDNLHSGFMDIISDPVVLKKIKEIFDNG
jgi:8-oxo-dGTP pyrophosphatase MutT (NUDIX family)